MSTNFFARIIPSHERKKELHDAIDSNDFRLINRLMIEMYDPIRNDWDVDEIIGGEVHLGKCSAGWKFLWNPNVFVVRNGHSKKIEMEPGCYRYEWIAEPDTPKYLYPLTKQGLHDFIFRDDILIYDEYDELQDKKEFWKMALKWGKKDGWDAASYEKEYPDHCYKLDSDLINLLEKEGYKFSSWTRSDFYSDGLRFSSSTDFR